MDTPMITPIKPPSAAGFFRRKDFPEGFIFGSATSAFQVEGGLREGNRGPSNWDEFSVENNLYAPYNENAVGHYYRYKEDVEIMKEIGLDAYRFSISWSRVMPNGRDPNEEGISFYNKLLEELLAHDIEPFVTIWHFDHPQILEDEYGGFLSSQMSEDFKNYADLCFARFGNKVKHWITVNEPSTFVVGAYVRYNMPSTDNPGEVPATPLQPPTGGRGFNPVSRFSFRPQARSALAGKKRSHTAISGDEPNYNVIRKADPSRDPYTAAHNLLLSHAKAVKLYKEKYQGHQQGQIGITLVNDWFVPYSDLPKDQEAAQRALDFNFGWFMEPLTSGEYPENMRKLVTGGRLPEFTKEESDMLKESYDFIGLNYYTSKYATDDPYSQGGDYSKDARVSTYTYRNGIPIGEPSFPPWLFVYPRGIMDMLVYSKTKYNIPVIYITENGVAELDDSSLPLWKALYDYKRVSFYYEHLWYVKMAIWLGVNVKGFFPWSLLDNLELSNGFKYRFGINYVDFKDGLKHGSTRFPKLSVGWFKFLLEK